jgi:ferredoxin
MKNLPFTPVIDQAACTLCEICIEHCPSGAITLESTITMDADICILCAACLKSCPESAISLGATPIAERMKMLHENCSERKEPEFFL